MDRHEVSRRTVLKGSGAAVASLALLNTFCTAQITPVTQEGGEEMMAIATTRTRSEVEQEIRETLGIVPTFFKAIPEEVLDYEWQLFKHWELGETQIPNKYKELLMLAVHAETHCRYCTLFHSEVARMFGATDEEIQEAVHLAKHSVGWSTYLNGTRADYDEFASELQQIGEYMSSKA